MLGKYSKFYEFSTKVFHKWSEEWSPCDISRWRLSQSRSSISNSGQLVATRAINAAPGVKSHLLRRHIYQILESKSTKKIRFFSITFAHLAVLLIRVGWLKCKFGCGVLFCCAAAFAKDDWPSGWSDSDWLRQNVVVMIGYDQPSIAALPLVAWTFLARAGWWLDMTQCQLATSSSSLLLMPPLSLHFISWTLACSPPVTSWRFNLLPGSRNSSLDLEQQKTKRSPLWRRTYRRLKKISLIF